MCFSDHRVMNVTVTPSTHIELKPKIRSQREVLNKNVFKQKLHASIHNKNIENFKELISLIQVCKSQAVTTHSIKHRENNNWINKEFVNLMKERDKLYKLKKIIHLMIKFPSILIGLKT